MTTNSPILLAPQWKFKKDDPGEISEYAKYLEEERIKRQEAAKKLKNERMELWNSVWFDRNYYVPFEKFQEFLTNPDFDYEYYSYKNIKEREDKKAEIMEEAYSLLDTYRTNFLHNEKHNPDILYYRQKPFITTSLNKEIVRSVLKEIKTKYGKEAVDFNFPDEEYEYGEEDSYNLDVSDFDVSESDYEY